MTTEPSEQELCAKFHNRSAARAYYRKRGLLPDIERYSVEEAIRRSGI
jgi:hypothetical protein